MRMLAAAAVLLLAASAACAACDDDAPSVPVPSSAAVADGTGFGLIHSADGKTITWDPLEYRGASGRAPGGEPKRTVGADRLAVEISPTAANDIPPPYRVWRVAVSAGRVVAIEQVRY